MKIVLSIVAVLALLIMLGTLVGPGCDDACQQAITNRANLASENAEDQARKDSLAIDVLGRPATPAEKAAQQRAMNDYARLKAARP